MALVVFIEYQRNLLTRNHVKRSQDLSQFHADTINDTDVIRTVITGLLKARREYSMSYPQVESSFPSQHRDSNPRLTTHDFSTLAEKVDLSEVHEMYLGTCLSLYGKSSSVYISSPLITTVDLVAIYIIS